MSRDPEPHKRLLPDWDRRIWGDDWLHGQTETGQGDIFHFTATRSSKEQ